jgi:hypothetical protein
MSKELTPEQIEQIREYTDELNKKYNYNIKQFDKQSMFISTGALAISLTLLKDIVPIANTVYIGFFYTSLIFFVASLLMGLIGFLFTSEIILNNIFIATRQKDGKIWEDKITRPLLFVNACCVFGGIVFMVAFTITNINCIK